MSADNGITANSTNVSSFRLKHLLLLSLILAVVFSIVSFGVSRFYNTDVYWHGKYLKQCIDTGTIPDAPLFYLIVASVTLFSSKLSTILVGLSVVLGVSVAARFFVSFRTIEGWPKVIFVRNKRLIMAIAFAMGILFCFPVPGEEYWFCSQFSPNLWHNSTYLVMVPVSIMLFNESMNFLSSQGKASVLKLTILSIVNVLIKPSFFFCFAPVFSIILLLKLKVSKLFAKGYIALFFSTIALAIYYWYVFVYTTAKESSDHGVGIGFFNIWSHYCHNIPLSFLNSMLVPVMFFAFYSRIFLKDFVIRYSLSLLLVGAFIYAFIQETGERNLDGNFWWQLPVCNYIVHLAVISAFFRLKELRTEWTVKDWILLACFGLQVVSGVVYIWKVATTGDFY